MLTVLIYEVYFMDEFIPPLEEMVEAFRRLPGVGRKSAERMAFGVLSMPYQEVERFAGTILGAKNSIKKCSCCFNISATELCPICSNEERDQRLICVVEDAKAVISFEKLKDYKGVYHVLGGVISPVNGITPDKIRFDSLVERVKEEGIKEVIIATNPTPDGEVTAMYISRALKPLGVKVTRLAYGIPVGADLEYADEVTLGRALEGRRDV